MKHYLTRALSAMLAFTLAAAPITSYAAWEKEGDSYVYYEKDGTKATNTLKRSGDKYFYLDENGQIVKNCEREVNGKIYTFDERGACDVNNWRKAGTSADEITAKNQWTVDNYKTSTEFVAISGRQQYMNQKANPYVDNQTVQWINATYAILTRSNYHNIKAFGGTLKLNGTIFESAESDAFTEKKMREELVNFWGVTDRDTADIVLENLINAGSVTGSGWDYSRAVSNLGYYYLAGYYEEAEALNKALEIAKVIQTSFQSWDEFADSYLVGYEAWSGDTSGNRRTIYENLKNSKFNPYALDWNLELVKNW